jgi:hypothetical protein
VTTVITPKANKPDEQMQRPSPRGTDVAALVYVTDYLAAKAGHFLASRSHRCSSLPPGGVLGPETAVLPEAPRPAGYRPAIWPGRMMSTCVTKFAKNKTGVSGDAGRTPIHSETCGVKKSSDGAVRPHS